MKIVAFIPSRYESKRFPGKPVSLIAGKPMIQHVYEQASACPEISDVVVATDDRRILASVQAFGGNAAMTLKRHPTGTDRIAEAARAMEFHDDDIILNIQGDQPLFPPSLISELIRPLKEDRELPMSTLKYKIRDELEIDNPNHVKVVTDTKDFALFFSRSPIPFYRDSRAEKVYYRHLGFYAYRMAFLTTFAGLPLGRLEDDEKLEQLRALEYGFRIKVVETSHDSIEVDTPEDIKRVEEMMCRSDPCPERI
jgi:3-deoxy-manno-octulosonate cytidylyltransferase (CMP-KDO synthetase)